MKCRYCGKEFTPLSVNQLYCSEACGARYRRRHSIIRDYPSLTFNCACCGKTVVTEEGPGDKRTRFCSRPCEKKYWKHPPNDRESSLTNFHSVQEYASWERRTNL